MIILHNPYSKASRNFVSLFSGMAAVIDWYNDHEVGEEYLALGYPPPGSFPVAVDEETKIKVDLVKEPGDLETAIREKNPKLVWASDGSLKIVKKGVDEVRLDIGGLETAIKLTDGVGVMPFSKKGDYFLEHITNEVWEVTTVVGAEILKVAPSHGVSVSADSATITAGLSVTLTVTSDVALASVPIAVWGDGVYLGSFDVPLTNGTGTITKSIDVAGSYVYQVDDVPHPDWPEMNLYRNEQSAEVVAI